MAGHFDGVYARDARVEILTEGDEYGADEIGPGRIGLAIDNGCDGAFIVEGTPAELLRWVRDVRRHLDAYVLGEFERLPAPAESSDE